MSTKTSCFAVTKYEHICDVRRRFLTKTTVAKVSNMSVFPDLKGFFFPELFVFLTF